MREKRIAGPRGRGKPLQIAVDDVTGTMEATRDTPGTGSTAPLAAVKDHLDLLSSDDYQAISEDCNSAAN
jgi:hypothetical protein